MEAQEKLAQRWTRSSAGYSSIIQDELASFRVKAWLDVVEAQVPKGKELKILDVGTGPGFFAIILSKAGYETIGIDCSPGMIQQAKANAQREKASAKFKVMDSHSMDFPDNTFDLILSRNVTWTLHNPIKAYKEWQRVLKPGGRLLIFDANWHLHQYDEELRKEVEQREELFRQTYGEPYDTYEGPEEEREIKVKLPLSDQHRPSWDNGALQALGFIDIANELDLTPKVWDEKERLLYGATPLFTVAARKNLSIIK